MDGSGRVVEVVAYDPSWPDRFDAERRLLAEVLPGASSIEHIGSTSVPGLAAKPIIDIVVVVSEVEEIAADVSTLERLGYVFRPLAFPDDGDHLFFIKDTDGKRTHHLHVFGARSPRPQENRVFRAYLAAHPEAAHRYERAKRAAAEAHPDSRARYGEAKAAVFFELLERSRLWSAQYAAVSTAARPPERGCSAGLTRSTATGARCAAVGPVGHAALAGRVFLIASRSCTRTCR